MVGAVLAIGPRQDEKHEKAWSFIGGWNGHLRRGAVISLQCSTFTLAQVVGGLNASSGPMILRVVRRNDKRKHEPNKGTPAGKVGAVLAIGGSKFSQI